MRAIVAVLWDHFVLWLFSVCSPFIILGPSVTSFSVPIAVVPDWKAFARFCEEVSTFVRLVLLICWFGTTFCLQLVYPFFLTQHSRHRVGVIGSLLRNNSGISEVFEKAGRRSSLSYPLSSLLKHALTLNILITKSSSSLVVLSWVPDQGVRGRKTSSSLLFVKARIWMWPLTFENLPHHTISRRHRINKGSSYFIGAKRMSLTPGKVSNCGGKYFCMLPAPYLRYNTYAGAALSAQPSAGSS